MKKEQQDVFGYVYIDGVKIGIITKPVPVELAPECRIGYAMTGPKEVFPDERYNVGPIEVSGLSCPIGKTGQALSQSVDGGIQEHGDYYERKMEQERLEYENDCREYQKVLDGLSNEIKLGFSWDNQGKNKNMYREDGWLEGHYIDNHKKYECADCGKQFIVGGKLLENCHPGFPVCPYCGQGNVECIVWTEDDQLGDLASDMGCLAISINEDKMVYKKLAEVIRKYRDNESLATEVEGLGHIQDVGTINNLTDFLEGMLKQGQ